MIILVGSNVQIGLKLVMAISKWDKGGSHMANLKPFHCHFGRINSDLVYNSCCSLNLSRKKVKQILKSYSKVGSLTEWNVVIFGSTPKLGPSGTVKSIETPCYDLQELSSKHFDLWSMISKDSTFAWPET